MESKKNKLLKSIMSLLIAFTSIGIFANKNDIFAFDEFTIDSEVVYNEERTEAIITLDVEGIDEKYAIFDIVDPNGENMYLPDFDYKVEANGEYTFEISYYFEEELYTYNKVVLVDEIDVTENTEIQTLPLNQNSVFNLRTSVVDGSAMIDIADYHELVGWGNGTIKDVAFSVDFGDDVTSSGKKLVIDLPEGLRFEQILVGGSYEEQGIDKSIISSFQAGSPLAISVVKTVIPKKETGNKIGSTFGKLEYEFTDGTKSATIYAKVRVDAARYYGEHTIANPIKAEAFKSGVTQGVAKLSINASGDPFGVNRLYSNGSGRTTEAFASTVDEDSIAKGRRWLLDFRGLDLAPTHGADRRYAKNVVYYIYYPEGMEFEGFDFLYNFNFDDATITDEPSNHRVIVETQWRTADDYFVKYKIPEGTVPGIYSNGQADYAEIEFYDGTAMTLTGDTVYTVEVLDDSLFQNKLSLAGQIGYSNDELTDENYEKVFSSGPYFRLLNDTAGVKKNQIIHYEIDESYETIEVNFVYDNTIANNSIDTIEYKTNKNDSWVSTSQMKGNGNVVTLSKYLLNLDDDEYFVEARAFIGDVSTVFTSEYSYSKKMLTLVGRLKKGVNEANVTMRTYDSNNESNSNATVSTKVKKASGTLRELSSDSNALFYSKKGKEITNVVAGESFDVKATISIPEYVYGQLPSVENPEIYIREPEGMNVAIDTLSIVDSLGNDFAGEWIKEEKVNQLGEKIYIVKLASNAFIGNYYLKDGTFEMPSLTVKYSVSTGVKLSGIYDIRELMAWGKPEVTPIEQRTVPVQVDIYDFNGNGSTTDTVLSFQSSSLKVVENRSVLVETFLTLEGESPKDPYVEGNLSTLSYFTPGTNADYTVKLTNNSEYIADRYTCYIPIPKTGENFGALFQSEDFNWDMKLLSKITSQTGFDITYASDATEGNYNTDANYEVIPSNLDNVNMVKIEATQPLGVGAEVEFKIPLKVDEDFNSASNGNKIGTKNVYNPVYDVDNLPAFSGVLPGTKVGTELVIAEIGGFVFNDSNADGLYKEADGDSLVGNHEVELYKWNETTLIYEAVLDSNSQPIVTKTDSSGRYLFDYTNSLGYGTYAVRFVEQTGGTYQYTVNNPVDRSIDSDAIVANDIPNAGDQYRGWVLGIDATKPVAKTIGCGFLDYNPPVELKVTLPSQTQIVKSGETTGITPVSIEPDFWESIKHTTDAYTWELVNASDSQYLTLSNTSSRTVSVAGVKKTSTPVEVRLTIKDIYGQTVSATTNVTVLTNVPPTITSSDKEYYVGDTLSLLTGVSAIDDYGNSITLNTGTSGNTVVSHAIPVEDGKVKTPGTYEVTYKVTDEYGNQSTKTNKVKVNGLPTVEALAQTYVVSDTTIAAQVLAAGTGSYSKASDTVGENPTVESLTPTYSIVNGPSLVDFSKEGIYMVRYSVTNSDGKTATKDVSLVVLPADALIENDLVMVANNFALTQNEAKNLTQNEAAQKAKVVAYEYIRKNGELVAIDDISLTITTSDLTNIRNVEEAGGEFILTFTATGNSGTISKDVTVVVEGSEIIVDNGIVIKAKDFELANVEAPLLTEELAKSNATVGAYELLTGTAITTIAANATELNTIKDSGLPGGDYPLTFTATSGSNTASIEVEVIVSPTLIKPVVVAADCEHHVGDSVDLLHGVTATDATGTSITLNVDGISKNTTITQSIPTESDKFTTVGTYEVTYKVKDSFENEGIVKRKVKVHGLPKIETTFQQYQISEDILTKVEAAASASYLEASATIGDTAIERDITSDIQASVISGPNGVLDFSAVGIYEIEYTVVNIYGKTATEKTSVLVLPQGTIVDQTQSLSIAANGFELTQDEAKALIEMDAIIKANAVAFETVRENGKVVSFEDITSNIYVYEEQLQAIKNVGKEGGIFDLVYEVESNGKSVSKLVKVSVQGTNTPPVVVTPDGDELAISANDFIVDYETSLTLDEAEAIALSGVEAYLLKAGELKTRNSIISIGVDSKQLNAIRTNDGKGGVYDLTFTADYIASNGTIVQNTVTVKVTVGAKTPVISEDTGVDTSDNTARGLYVMLLAFATITLVLRKEYNKRA